jgi:hypothetical protein
MALYLQLVGAQRTAISMPQAATTDVSHIKADSLQPLCRSRSLTPGDMWGRKTAAVPRGRWQALDISICCR